ncbi:MAG: helix-turn-helix domain-containing protein [Coprococcus sp.]
MRYNERIREMRINKDMTQKQVADILHIGQRTYADYESGKTRIPVDSLLKLAKHYNVSVDYISGVSNEKKAYPSK